MSKAKHTKKKREVDRDLRSHYDVDYSHARPNRFAKVKKEQTAVLLDRELSKIFPTPEDVTHALRSLVDAIPHKGGRSGLARP